MQTGLDRRTFLARAAVASGGLMSMGALERLVTRDAFAHGRPAPSRTGRCAAPRTSAGSRCSRSPRASATSRSATPARTMSDGNPTPLALDGMGAFAARRGRGHGHGHGHGHGDHLVRLVRNSEDRNPAGTPAACSATAPRPTTRPATAARPRSSTTSSGGSSSRTS